MNQTSADAQYFVKKNKKAVKSGVWRHNFSIAANSDLMSGYL
jgi:hypothetical protein